MLSLSNTKKITLGVINTASLLIAVNANALGIGNIKLHSKLNEPLRADIELLDANKESATDIYVNLAPPKKFAEANIAWNYFFNTIKLKPVKRANGSIIIELSSTAVVKEVFLDFIVEVSWKRGLLYRNFTVLIDPPADYISPEPTPIAVLNRPLSLPSYTHKTTQSYQQKQYGPVKPSDYIRSIAKKTRYPDVSIEQMIIALFHANPEAFSADNINALTIKKMLTIPDKEDVLTVTRKEASAEVTAQNTLWQERVTAKAHSHSQLDDTGTLNIHKHLAISTAKKPNEQPSPPVSRNFSSTDIIAIVDKLDKLEQKMELMQSVLIAKERLTLLPPSSNDAGSTDDADTKKELATPNTEVTALTELTQKMASMQQMLAAKDALIASLQAQNKTVTTLSAPTVAPLALPETPKNSSVTHIQTVSWLNFDTIVQMLTHNSKLLLQSSLAGGVFLSVVGYIRWSRKKKRQAAEDEALQNYFKPLDLAKSSFKNLSVSFNDFLSNEHLYNVEVAHKDTDVMTEVDICLTYKYYTNAESLLRQAIESYPENNDYKLKLLEVFSISDNQNDFKAFKNQLTKVIKPTNEAFWQAVSTMEASFIAEAPATQNNDTSLDNYTFDDSEVAYIAKATIESIDKPAAITDADTAAEDKQALPAIKADAVLITTDTTTLDDETALESFEFTDINLQTDAESITPNDTPVDDDIIFEMYAFDINSASADGELMEISDVLTEDEISLETYEFNDFALNTVETESNAAVDDDIVFEMYDFEDIAIKADVNTAHDNSALDFEQLVAFDEELTPLSTNLAHTNTPKKYRLSHNSRHRLLKNPLI